MFALELISSNPLLVGRQQRQPVNKKSKQLQQFLGESSGSSMMSSTTISTAALESLVHRLKFERNRSSTRKMYYGVWRCFNSFFIKLDDKPSFWEERLTLFVGYLIEQNRKSSTIKSYISAIKAVLREDDVILNEDRYLLTSLTKACKYKNEQVRIRLPIQKSLLRLIIQSMDDLFDNQSYLCCLYKAMLATGYFGLLMVGEIASGTHPVLAPDVHLGINKKKVVFVLRTSKTHWCDRKPQQIKLSPVKPHHLHKTLKTAISCIGLPPQNYNVHSLRIGCPVDHYSVHQIPICSIQKIGRWRSNSVFTYLS